MAWQEETIEFSNSDPKGPYLNNIYISSYWIIHFSEKCLDFSYIVEYAVMNHPLLTGALDGTCGMG